MNKLKKMLSRQVFYGFIIHYAWCGVVCGGVWCGVWCGVVICRVAKIVFFAQTSSGAASRKFDQHLIQQLNSRILCFSLTSKRSTALFSVDFCH